MCLSCMTSVGVLKYAPIFPHISRDYVKAGVDLYISVLKPFGAAVSVK